MLDNLTHMDDIKRDETRQNEPTVNFGPYSRSEAGKEKEEGGTEAGGVLVTDH